jgi:hypothetical protein
MYIKAVEHAMDAVEIMKIGTDFLTRVDWSADDYVIRPLSPF